MERTIVSALGRLKEAEADQLDWTTSPHKLEHTDTLELDGGQGKRFIILVPALGPFAGLF